MTAKKVKNSTAAAEDVPRKKAANGAATQQGVRSRAAVFFSTVFYVAVMGAVALAAFYLQQLAEEINRTHAEQEQSARRSAEMASTVERVLVQVGSLRSNVDGLESSLGVTRVELEAAVSRLKRGEAETRKVEETLQKLQNDLLRDLAEGVKEVKEARERDFSSLEKTVEERLAEVSQSVAASVAEFTEAQGEAQSQLSDLKARLGDVEDPSLLKQELSSIVNVVAEIKTAKEAADVTANSLREQIGSVREELQTRNQEVASLSEELENVRSTVQETAGALRQSLATAEAGVQVLKDQTEVLQSGVERVTSGLRSAEEKIDAEAARAQKNSEELDSRIRSSEEIADSLGGSVADISGKVETLFSQYDAHESSLAAQGDAVQKIKSAVETMQSTVEELQARKADEGKESSDQQMEDLEKRLVVLEDASRSKQLEGLQSVVEGLEKKAEKLEGHDQAISALQDVLQETTEKLSVLLEGKKDEDAA